MTFTFLLGVLFFSVFIPHAPRSAILLRRILDRLVLGEHSRCVTCLSSYKVGALRASFLLISSIQPLLTWSQVRYAGFCLL
jgi:hypothetical protein